jgi:hypothetical protein
VICNLIVGSNAQERGLENVREVDSQSSGDLLGSTGSVLGYHDTLDESV